MNYLMMITYCERGWHLVLQFSFFRNNYTNNQIHEIITDLNMISRTHQPRNKDLRFCIMKHQMSIFFARVMIKLFKCSILKFKCLNFGTFDKRCARNFPQTINVDPVRCHFACSLMSHL